MKQMLKTLLYKIGALGLYHRLANRRALTVLMFHRVLAPGDRRWHAAEREWVVTEEFFRSCLQFIVRHYNVISLEQLRAAHQRGAPLPPRPLLITFDDGWSDNADYAQPLLREYGLPAAIFVVIGAVRGSASSQAQRQMIERHAPLLADRRNVLSQQQIRLLVKHGMHIGSHGVTHVPLPQAASPYDEFAESSRRLTDTLRGSRHSTDLCFAFPHGRYDTHTAKLALAAGYRLLFNSVPCLNRLPNGVPTARHYGRIHVSERALSDAAGRLRPERLALWLFRRERTRLDGIRSAEADPIWSTNHA